MSTITSVIEQLDQYLKTNRPDYYSILNPALTNEELVALEEEYGVQLPADLKALYQWKNGHSDEHFSANFIELFQFFSLDISLRMAHEHTEMIGSDFSIENWWNKNWIPFLTEGSDAYCYDMEGTFTGNKGQILRFIHDDNWRPVIAPDLDSFLQHVVNAMPNNICTGFGNGQVSMEHLPGYPLDFEVNKKLQNG